MFRKKDTKSVLATSPMFTGEFAISLPEYPSLDCQQYKFATDLQRAVIAYSIAKGDRDILMAIAQFMLISAKYAGLRGKITEAWRDSLEEQVAKFKSLIVKTDNRKHQYTSVIKGNKRDRKRTKPYALEMEKKRE